MIDIDRQSPEVRRLWLKFAELQWDLARQLATAGASASEIAGLLSIAPETVAQARTHAPATPDEPPRAHSPRDVEKPIWQHFLDDFLS